MDPALALSAVVAATFLMFWLLASAPGFVRRVAAVRVPLLPSPIAGLVAGSLLLSAVLRDRPAQAETPPPMVRLATPAAGAAPPVSSPTTATAPAGVYVVVVGDSLWAIADRHLASQTGEPPTSSEIDRFWREIYEVNHEIIGSDPNLIFPGQHLRIPKG
ncbi:MAG: LysM peptidoglycan-binding domain-containing protein [Actinomycetota bacterium]|nr:LysM peptidoglycan-binding domain-containing protein [Actinomycetota bacterium]